MPENRYEDKTTPTETFLPTGVEIPDAVIAELSAGIEVGEAPAPEQGPGSALPPRVEGPVPEHSLAARLRARAEGAS